MAALIRTARQLRGTPAAQDTGPFQPAQVMASSYPQQPQPAPAPTGSATGAPMATMSDLDIRNQVQVLSNQSKTRNAGRIADLNAELARRTQTASAPALGVNGTATTAATGWWNDPAKVLDVWKQFETVGPQMPDVSPEALNKLKAQQAANLVGDVQQQYERNASSLAGYLGSLNMNQSGLGIGTLSEQALAALREQNRVGTDLAAIEAQNNLDYARYVGDYGLNRFNTLGNMALGFGQLGLNSQTQLGDLAIRQQQLALQGELGRGELQLNRDLGMGDLGIRQQGVNQQNEQFYAGQNFTAGQADLDRAFQVGMQDRQYSFQGQQSDLTRQHEIELAQLAATNQQAAMQLQQAFQAGQAEADRQFQGGQNYMNRQTQLDLADKQAATQLQQISMQLADAAAGRQQASQQFLATNALATAQLAAQIEQNRSQNTLESQQLQNQLALGMGQLGVQQQQLGLNAQQQQMSGLTSFLGLGAQGLNMNNPLAQQVLGMYGVGGQQQQGGTPQIPRQTPTFKEYLVQRGYPAWYADYNWSTQAGVNPVQPLAAEYAAMNQEGPGTQPLWTAKPPTWTEVAALQQVQNTANKNQMDFFATMAGLNAKNSGGGSPQLGSAAAASAAKSLPSAAQNVLDAVISGKPASNTTQAMEDYWLPKLKSMGLIAPDAIKDYVAATIAVRPRSPAWKSTKNYNGNIAPNLKGTGSVVPNVLP